MSDPYQLAKENDDVPPRIRLVGGEYPQAHDQQPPERDPLKDREPATPQENGAPWSETGPLSGYRNEVDTEQEPAPQFDDWQEVPFHVRLRKKDDGTHYCYLWPGYVVHVDTTEDTAPISYWLPTGMSKTAEYVVADAKTIGVYVETDYDDVPTSATIEVRDTGSIGANQQAKGDPDNITGKYFYRIADFAAVGGVLTVSKVYQLGFIKHVGRLGTAVAGGETTGFPFKAYLSGVGEASLYIGHLVTSIPPQDEMAVADASPITLEAGLKVWIYLETSGLTPVSATIDSGTDWFNGDDAIAFDVDDEQIAAHVKVGELLSGALPTGAPGFNVTLEETEYHFLQYLRTNLFVSLMTVDGKAAIFMLPFSG